MKKSELRIQLRQQRQVISTEQRYRAAQMAATVWREHPLFQTHHTFAAYLGLDEEFDAMPIIQEIWRAQKQCYLPVINESEKNLKFMRYHPDDALHRNRYHILEPMSSDAMLPENLDIVLLPLVGFDLRGNRLGMGAGYYDRTFQFLLKNPQKKHPKLIGLAYAFQLMNELDADPWDVPLDAVVSEEGVRVFC